MSYTRFGPFSDGGSPGISAEFLNPVEDVLVALNSAATDANISADGSGKLTIVTLNVTSAGTVLNGGTSGTATLIEDCVGTIKRTMILLNNFRTAAAAQTIAFPVAYAKGAHVNAGEIGTSGSVGGFSLLLSSVAQTIRICATLSATGGTYSNATVMYQGLSGDCKTGFDTIQFPASGTNGANGYIIITGQ